MEPHGSRLTFHYRMQFNKVSMGFCELQGT